jgi:catechol 2,3-dioxygenase-like lactoylglutathione lyase family enzyme
MTWGTSTLVAALILLAQDKPAAPVRTAARFHHVHVNAIDPRASVQFYTSKFEAEKSEFAGVDGVWTYKSWVLFKKVGAPPPHEITSAIWHIGWGAEDMKAEYARQLGLGTKFETPITDISDLAGRPPGQFFFAYVDGPDHELIELNTASHHHFGHVHMLSEDPIAAGEWYHQHLGIEVLGKQTKAQIYRTFPVGPASFLQAGHVSIIIYPVEYARVQWPEVWAKRKSFDATRGRAIDHIAFSVDDLASTLDRLRSEGVNVLEPVRTIAGGTKIAFIEGPDRVWIELVEGHATKP